MDRTRPVLLLVEDDPDLGHVLELYLEMNGFSVTLARNGREGLREFAAAPFDLCLLDVMLPELDGFALARAIRERRDDVPFLFLTARSTKEDRLHGLRLGAADYICKPFEADELVLKVRNLLDRHAGPANHPIRLGRYRLDPENLVLAGPRGERRLTRREADLLGMLLAKPGQVVRKREILARLWGEEDYFTARSLDVFISRLRRYLAHDPAVRLLTVRAEGYVLSVDPGPDG
ncbi:MAG TPA: response regulator transcription factor [Candidatus Aminicenantes bacterium]|nr:response regulator transcription factor [Candidatus Aminicenantes bacterium]